jgi:hypothetical protein
MGLDERIEAARKRLWQQSAFHSGLINHGMAWDACEDAAKDALRAAFPELFQDPPAAVIVTAGDVAHADALLVRKVLSFEQAETLLARSEAQPHA